MEKAQPKIVRLTVATTPFGGFTMVWRDNLTGEKLGKDTSVKLSQAIMSDRIAVQMIFDPPNGARNGEYLYDAMNVAEPVALL